MSLRETKALAREVKKQISIISGFVAIFWISEILDQFIFRNRLNIFGIIPRQVIGLRGIIFAPFLHGDFQHLIANTVPFVILGWLVMIQNTSDFWLVTVVTMLVGGLGVWLFAATGSVHIGASMLIFGYLGFLLFRGFFQRNLPSILLSIIVGLLYGGLVWGVLPSAPQISWQGHLFGFIAGVMAAKMVSKN